MDNKEQIKNELINFIQSSLDNKKIKLLKKENKDNHPKEIFSSHKNYITHNKEIVNLLSDEELDFHYELMNLIKLGEIKLIDQENFYENDAVGFYFKPYNPFKVVILWND
jgi:hypothetical protein